MKARYTYLPEDAAASDVKEVMPLSNCVMVEDLSEITTIEFVIATVTWERNAEIEVGCCAVTPLMMLPTANIIAITHILLRGRRGLFFVIVVAV